MKFTVRLESRPDMYGVRSINRTLIEECIESQEELFEFFKLVMQAATFVVEPSENLELVKEPEFEEEPSSQMSEERYDEIRHSFEKEVFTEDCDEEDCTLCHPTDEAEDESDDSYLRNAQILFEDESDKVLEAFKKAKKVSKKKKKKKSSKKKAK